MATKPSARKSRKEAQNVRSAPVWAQLVALALLIGVSVAAWVGRDQVSAFVSGISGADLAQKKNGGLNGGVPVVVAKVEETRDDTIVGAIGTGRAQRSVMLAPEVSGEVEHLFVAAGEHVNAEQTLIRLDAREAELAVRVARTRLIEVERLLKRAEQLREKNIASQATVDDARNVVDRARFELDQAEEALDNRELRAPFNGVVGIPKIEPGDRVSPDTDIMTLDDRSQLVVEFEVPEQFISRLRAGQALVAKTPSFPRRNFEGYIEYIDSRVDPTSRSVMIRGKFPNRDDILRPGMSFVVDLTIGGPSYPTVPELALQWRKGKSYVWRVRDGKSERVDVRSVRRLNSTILVEGDLTKGDLVVVEGVHRLRPGRKVNYTAPAQVPSS